MSFFPIPFLPFFSFPYFSCPCYFCMQSAELTADAPHPGPASSRFRVRSSLASRIQFHFCQAHAALLHLTLAILTRRRPFFFFPKRSDFTPHLGSCVARKQPPPLLLLAPEGTAVTPQQPFSGCYFFIRCHVCMVTPLCDPWYRRPILMGL